MCKALLKAEEAERILRDALNENQHDLALTDAAKLGDCINGLVRWQNNHHQRCVYCEADRVSQALAETV